MKAMSVNKPKLDPKTALLWIDDNQSTARKVGRAYAFGLAPKNPKSRYVALDTLHLETPSASRDLVKEWLLILAPPKQKKASPKPSS